MSYSTNKILLQSLVGSRVNIPHFTAVQNAIMKHVLPPKPFIPQSEEVNITTTEDYPNEGQDLWQPDKSDTSKMFHPLSFKKLNDTQWWLLPYEPIITISSRNNIIKRNVAKGGEQEGSIKERWSRDDYAITITGALIGDFLMGDTNRCYPREDMERLRDYCIIGEAIEVKCEPLHILKIDRIVIEDFSFPFTRGEEVQAYEIRALSDSSYNLLIEVKDDV